MIRLVDPDPQRHADWLAAYDDFDDGAVRHGFGVYLEDPAQLRDPAHFAEVVRRQLAGAYGRELPEGYVPATCFWITDDSDIVLGALQLRHTVATPFLLNEGGHIGYGVRRSARGRGVATAALREAVRRAHGLGIDRVLLTCDLDNLASARTIERCGGVLEDERAGKRRYWIRTSP
ncbi:GNAT family N-acetyltransferase [Calidifontibacter sp. DB0510]|uniref:GNAT family N-acetyltransferase n=1 Tax=Metallococcus carri TaxID=1656884 RepID=A0A967B270_9MICO|nr:GNAT family N-acetyltransferase [Metallococcus carri]NHN56619.1 GNAT family N-acetyltransferase [Metallococcus carri]NOP38918.1 GNAT family N-acetyltransferase [Calidifontibacter sp. DB2511S]